MKYIYGTDDMQQLFACKIMHQEQGASPWPVTPHPCVDFHLTPQSFSVDWQVCARDITLIPHHIMLHKCMSLTEMAM